MAKTVYLNDGTMEVILTDKPVFLERLLREKLGDDAAQCFTECIEELRWMEESTKEQERIADGYLAMCREACENFSEILKMLEAPRLNRAALKEAVQAGYYELYNNL